MEQSKIIDTLETYHFCPVDEEERGKPGRPVWRGADTPEDSRQLVKPTAG